MSQGTQMAEADDAALAKSYTKMDNKLQIAAAPTSQRPTVPPWVWIVGSAVTLTVPFWRKWMRALLRLEGVAERAVENAAEVVQKAAEMAEKVLEEVAEELPLDGQLKDAILFAESAAKEIAKDAELTISFTHKVDELIKREEETMKIPQHDQEEELDKEAKDS